MSFVPELIDDVPLDKADPLGVLALARVAPLFTPTPPEPTRAVRQPPAPKRQRARKRRHVTLEQFTKQLNRLASAFSASLRGRKP